MLGELHSNGRTSCIHVNNIHIKQISSHLNGQNGFSHAGNGTLYADIPNTLTESFPKVTMRNPKLFYEAAFIARPKLQDALNLRQNRTRQCEVTEKVTSAYSPASSTGTGHTGSGVSTPDSLKGNLRKEIPVERRPVGEKKRVQFDLQKKNIFGISENSDEEEVDEEVDEFDEIEKSLMQGFSEYDIVANGLTNGHQLTNGHSTRKKPQLRLDFGFLSSANSKGQRGETIDAELPLDQQTWYFGAISRQEAEEILRNCSEGCYIVRACELAVRRDYSLAIKSSCGFMHLRIHRQPDDLYRLADFNRVFVTVPDLIEYYSCEKLPIRGAEYTILLHPVHQQLL